MSKRESTGGFLPGFVRRDFIRKSIALFFAIIVFWKVSREIGVEGTIDNVSLEISPPSGYVVLEDRDISLKITVRASDQKTFLDLNPADFKFTIETPEIKGAAPSGQISFNILESSKIVKPLGVEILGVRPDTVSVRLDHKVSRELPVKVKFSGAVQSSYTCGEVFVSPEKAVLSGPATVLDKMREIQTEPVVLDERTIEDFECAVRLDEPEKAKAEPREVKVQVEVYRKMDTRRFASVPVKILPPANPALKVVRISPTNIDITVQGVKSTIEKMGSSEIKPFVDLSATEKPGALTAAPLCFIGSPDARVLEISPAEITVEVISSE